eukprot:TRINITY_DN1940_c0_g1_i1.p1 TRINITY_DN1940_c0_g1~~TRINITY_DN1940_c0_g1_i1.p1  ORF type:complete len:300 (-),score=60.87 TRINITY_DN1940_c0_g1_i1:966-1865(-)
MKSVCSCIVFVLFVFVVVVVRGASEESEWNYKLAGSDWEGTCATSNTQSPINIPMATQDIFEIIPQQLQASFYFGQSDSVKVENNGHNIEFVFEDNFSDIRIPVINNKFMGILEDDLVLADEVGVETVPAKLENFHIHSSSEHTYDGGLARAEGHFVMSVSQKDLSSCPESSCSTVVGVRFQQDPSNSENEFLADVLNSTSGQFPSGKGASEDVQTTLDFNKLLPADMQYAMYNGSLTTPPCTENVLWHVVFQPIPISVDQVLALQAATSLTNDGVYPNNRITQPLNDRKLFKIGVERK